MLIKNTDMGNEKFTQYSYYWEIPIRTEEYLLPILNTYTPRSCVCGGVCDNN